MVSLPQSIACTGSTEDIFSSVLYSSQLFSWFKEERGTLFTYRASNKVRHRGHLLVTAVQSCWDVSCCIMNTLSVLIICCSAKTHSLEWDRIFHQISNWWYLRLIFVVLFRLIMLSNKEMSRFITRSSSADVRHSIFYSPIWK